MYCYRTMKRSSRIRPNDQVVHLKETTKCPFCWLCCGKMEWFFFFFIDCKTIFS